MSSASRAIKRLDELYKALLFRMRLLNARRFHPCRSTPVFPGPSRIEPLEPRVLLSGTIITVDTFADVVDEYDGLTSLREAIAMAAENPGDDEIDLPTGSYALDPAYGQLSINDSSGALSILGIDGEATLDAQSNSRVMEVAYGSTVALENVSIENGAVSTGSGGGVWNQGQLALRDCTVVGNTVYEGPGGGVHNDVEAGLFLENTLFLGNGAPNGGGVSNFGEMEIRNGTFFLNQAESGPGGAISNHGSAIVLNSTLAQNTAYSGGGMYNSPYATAFVTNVTIARNNSMDSGGGVLNEGTLLLDNTILAENFNEAGPGDLLNNGLVESRLSGGPTNNLLESPAGHAILNGVDGNIVGQPAMLGPLSDNGGVTPTMLPDPVSPAVDHGNDPAAYDAGLYYDQRGENFPRFAGLVDIGAVEAGASSPEPEIDVTYDATGEQHDVDFGEVVANESQTFYLQVQNTGDGVLNVTSLGSLDAPFGWQLYDSSGAMDWNIEPGGWRELELTFAPTSGGQFTDTLCILSNDTDEAQYDVQLTGRGLVPPTVTATLPTVDEEYNTGDPNGADPGQVTVEFSAPMDPAAVTDPANYDLRLDTDEDGDFTDETTIPLVVTTTDNQTVYLDTGDILSAGEYELQLAGLSGVSQILQVSETPTRQWGVCGLEMSDDWMLWGDDPHTDPDNLWYVWDGEVAREIPVGEGVWVWDSAHLVNGGVAWWEPAGSAGNDYGDLYFWDGASQPIRVGQNVQKGYGVDGARYWLEEDGLFAWIDYFDHHIYLSQVGGVPQCISETPTTYWEVRGFELQDGNVLWGDDPQSDGNTSWYLWDGNEVHNLSVPTSVSSMHLVSGGVAWVEETPTSGTGDLYFWDLQSSPEWIGADVRGTLYLTREYRGWVEENGQFVWVGGDGGVYAGQSGAPSVWISQATPITAADRVWISDNRALWGGWEIDDSYSWYFWDGTETHRIPINSELYADENHSVRLVDGGVAWREMDSQTERTDLYFWDTQSDPAIIASDIADGPMGWQWTENDGRFAWGRKGDGHIYTAELLQGLQSDAGVPLDGDADGDPGGNWLSAFTIHQPEIDVEYDGADDVHSLSLARIDLGETTSQTFTIRNEGDAPLEIDTITFADGSSFSVTDEFGEELPSSILLNPQETIRVQVVYTPAEQGRDFDTLYLASNDADESVYEIAVTGEALLPQGEGYYEVWGGTTDYRSSDPDDMWWQPYHNIDQQDYTYLGGGLDAWGATEFLGSTDYDYYVIATRARVQVDAVEGSDPQYAAYSAGDGNTYDWSSISGPPDEQYATVGYQGNSDSFCGFVILENTYGWDGMVVYTGNIDLPMHLSIEQNAVSDGTGQAYLYEHYTGLYDQGWSTGARFQAPSGQWYDMWWDDEDDSGWEYWNESFTDIPDMVSEFGDGWYTFEASGSPFGTTTAQVWFGDQNGETPLAWPTQVPEITNIPPGDTDVPASATLEFSPVTDPNVTNIYSDVEDVHETDWARYWSDPSETSFGPAELEAGTNYEWDLDFENSHNGLTNSGRGYYVSRSQETSSVFRTADGQADLPNLAMGEVFYTPGVYNAGETIEMDFLLGNLGDGNAVLVGQDGLVDFFYDEVRLSFDTTWGNDDDVVIYRRPDTYWMGQEATDTRTDPSPKENWFAGLPTIPDVVERGNYYVLAGIDVENQVAESNESDNIWISDAPDISVETLDGAAQVKHVLSVGVANPGVKFRGDVAAQRVHEAFDGMEGVQNNLLVRYNIGQTGNRQHLLDTLKWFESRVLPGDQFIFYIASQACHALNGAEAAVDAQYDTRKGKWNRTRVTTGDEYLYLSNADNLDNWLSDDKLATSFFTFSWAAADKLFILDTPYAGGFFGTDDPENESQYDLALLHYDPAEELEAGQIERTRWATGSVDVIAAAGEGQFAFMTPEKPVGWAGVNRMGTHMIAPILAQTGPEHDVLDVEQLFWKTKEANSIYCNDVGLQFAFADGDPDAEAEDNSGGTVLDPTTGLIHVQLGADVKQVRYFDADGSGVTLKLTGGVADLAFHGANLRQTFSRGVLTVRGDDGAMLNTVQLIDTTAAHTLSISVAGGNRFTDLGGVIGGGSLKQLLATRVNLVGEGIALEGNAFIGVTRLHNIKNGADVTMAGVGPALGVRFFAATVDDGTEMNFGGAIRSLYLNRWVGGSLKGRNLVHLRIRRNMGADVTLTGTNGLGQSIFNARIFGQMTGGAWNIAGAVRSWFVRGNVSDADLRFNGMTNRMFVRGSLFNSTVNLSDARIVRVVRRVDGSAVSSTGDIRTMIVGAMLNSTVFAGVRAEYDTDANGDGVLDLPDPGDLLNQAGRITHFQVRGMRGIPNAFRNSNLAAGSFGSVRLKTSTLENPTGVGGTSQTFGLVSAGDGVGRLRLTLNRRNYFWRNHTWTRNLDPRDLAVFDTA